MNSVGEEDDDENMWTGQEETVRSNRSTDPLQNNYGNLYPLYPSQNVVK
jgi:hypothetical protein